MWSTASGDRSLAESVLLRQVVPAELLLNLQSENNQIYLDTLSRIALDSRLTSLIFTSFEPVFPDIISRWTGFTTFQEFAGGLAKLLPVAPYLVPYAEHYLLGDGVKAFPSPYQNQTTSLPQIFTKDLHGLSVESIQTTLLSLLRLLKFNFSLFSPLARLEHIWSLLEHPSVVIRYLSLQIAALYLNIADTAFEKLLEKHCGEEPIIGEIDGVSIDFRFFWTDEARRLDSLQTNLKSARVQSTEHTSGGRVISTADTSFSIVSVAGIQFLSLPESERNPEGHVETATALQNLSELATAVRTGDPVLIQGRQGCGKTHYVHHVARLLGNSKSLISIHLGKQTDTKLLLGTYVSSEPPGTFKWKPGVLTTAVKEGRWILIEDLDQAPNEVLSLLIPLMQRRTLFIPNRAETIIAPSNFRLIATVRTLDGPRDGADSLPPNLSTVGIRLWHRVTIQQPSQDEIVAFINARYPSLSRFSTSLVKVYDSVRAIQSSSSTRDRLFRGPSLRQIGLRELLNWCNRIDLHIQLRPTDSRSGVISEYLLDMIFIEAMDCFAGQYSDNKQEKAISDCVARGINLDLTREAYLTDAYLPTYQDGPSQVLIGRTGVSKKPQAKGEYYRKKQPQSMPYAMHKYALRLLERVSVCVNTAEPVLLVGETGTGKTTAVQHLANLLNVKLTVHNFSQQTESSDLMGGFQPMDLSRIGMEMATIFDTLFRRTFPSKKNLAFLDQFDQAVLHKQWKKVVRFWLKAIEMANKHLAASVVVEDPEDGILSPRKRRKLEAGDHTSIAAEWEVFVTRVSAFDAQLKSSPQQAIFNFVEGLLVKAVRNGEWVLLDELNLAAPETLESIADLMNDAGSRSMLLLEKGGVERIYAHPDFRIFGCMNPATDVGKRDLPQGIRSRFTEFYVPNPDGERANVLAIVKAYLESHCVGVEQLLSKTTDLYLDIRAMVDQNRLVDGAGQKPVYSIRTLARTLAYVVEIAPVYGILRSLYEGFCMAFLTCLATESENLLHRLIEQRLLSDHSNARSLLKQVPRMPTHGEYTQFKHYWMLKGPAEVREQPDYIITPYVERNLLNLVRAAATRKYPVLIQGPTSSGKTSMIKFLANRTGHKFVRINNHEHTDLQEYLGSYVSDASGSLKFQEGALIQAMRTGCWVILDELNLAPTDVLEALNRLLDDNREILIPETQEVVRPHKDFMLFATQNPPGLYAGRKALSKAFRNRFIELHFDDIPQNELQDILQQRTQIAPSFAARIVTVYNELSVLRQSSRLFEQKQSFATLRDLFRWANRDAVTNEELAQNGYMLLAERVRNQDEKLAVKKVIEAELRVQISDDVLYNRLPPDFGNQGDGVVWTKAMARLYTLLERAIVKNEPVLLVGETGCGKTTVCQLLALALRKNLETVNAHMNTETGDIIGAYRPLRNRAEFTQRLLQSLQYLFSTYFPDQIQDGLKGLLRAYDQLQPEVKLDLPQDIINQIQDARTQASQLFEWVDGSLVGAMRKGDLFLLDEISLAEDSVLERLNSVLEPEREIFLAEKGYKDAKITAHPEFQFFATMNPGGDYGKKELSPALRNRFTEIWVPPMYDFDDVLQITETKLIPIYKAYASAMVKFGFWFNQTFRVGKDGSVSIRDIISWIQFCNKVDNDPLIVVFQGALMVYVDTLGSNPAALLSVPLEQVELERQKCVSHLSTLLQKYIDLASLEATGVHVSPEVFQVGAFALPRNISEMGKIPFDFNASTTSLNAMRVMRAMQLSKPILLEGAPGVGKTSLITALAAVVGIPLVRINLSEETDMMDLFGSDVPAENGAVGTFVFREAPFLQAMQTGQWVLLDEMNLASQSVLEGLNSCLDHRKTVYIPELGKTFHCHPNFRLFAAQNPHHQGNGRKGLPASFVNRFTVVYIRSLQQDDLLAISRHTFPNFAAEDYAKIVEFSSQLSKSLALDKSFGVSGAPWEFNLRDTLRWLEITARRAPLPAQKSLEQYFRAIVSHRFRTEEDVSKVSAIFKRVFGSELDVSAQTGFLRLSSGHLQVGNALTKRQGSRNSQKIDHVELLPTQLSILETILNGVNNRWPCLLVGAPGSGKSSMVEALAKSAGAYLEVIPLNNDTETSDVIGGYEQEDPFRLARTVVQQLHADLEALVVECSLSSVGVAQVTLALVDNLHRWEPTYQSLEVIITMIQVTLESLVACAPERLTGIERHLQTLKRVASEQGQKNSVSFAWYDGALVRAVENGHWVILDNANLCNPSVLDRINSLLETKGALFLHEHTSADGGGRVIIPHPDFRLFLTMDPRNGELSRAMRNRSIEIFVPSVEEKIEDWSLGQSKLLNLVDQSTARTFARIDYLIRHALNTDPTHFDTWLYHIFEEAPARLVPTIFPWLSQNLPKSDAAIGETANKAVITFQEIKDQSVGRLLLEFKTNLCIGLGLDAEFIASESLHSLSNVHLLGARYAQADSQKLASLLSDFYEVALSSAKSQGQLVKIIEFLKSQRRLRTINNANDAKDGQPDNIDKEARIALLEFLSNLNNTIWSWLGQINLGGEVLGMDRINPTPFYELLLFLGFIFKGRELDGLVFQACSDRVRAFLNSISGVWPDTTMHQIQLSMQNLVREYGLGSGFSWTRLWKALRVLMPQSDDGMVFLRQLKAVTQRFDEALQGMTQPNGQVLQLRLSFVKAFEQIRTSNSTNQIAISEFNEAVNMIGNSGAAAVHSFHEVFNMILRIHLLASMNSASSDLGTEDFNALSYYSNSSTQNLSRLLGYLGLNDTPRDLILNGLFGLTTPVDSVDLKKSLASNEYYGAYVKKILQTSDVVQGTDIGGYSTIQSDLQSLGKHYTLAIAKNTTPYWKEFDTLLLNKTFSICHLHRDLFLGNSFSTLSNNNISVESLLGLLESGRQSPDERWSIIVSNYLVPSLKALLKSQTESENTAKSRNRGLAWIQYAIGCLKLLVPAHPYDPALQERLNHQLFQHRQQTLQTELSSLEVVTEVLNGSRDNARTQRLKQRIQAVTWDNSVSLFQRSQQTNFEPLCHLLQKIVALINGQQIQRFAKNVHSGNSDVAAAGQAIRENVRQILQQLVVQDDAFEDITVIVAEFVSALEFGILIACEADSPSKDGSDYIFTPNTLSPTAISEKLGTRTSKTSEPELRSLRALALRVKVEGLASFTDAEFKILDVTFARILKLWERKERDDAKEREEATKMYHFKGLEVVDPDDDEAGVAEMFSEGVPKAGVPKAKNDLDVQALASQVSRLHAAIFAGSSVDDIDIASLQRDLGNQMKKSEENIYIAPGNMEKFVPSMVLNISDAETWLNRTSKSAFNFYKDENPTEVRTVVELLNGIKTRIADLIALWPENDILRDVNDRTTEALQLPLKTPVNSVLSKLEGLHAAVHQWEQVASKEYSLTSYQENLTNVIVGWRKLELQTWPSLFTQEETSSRSRASTWWFHIYKAVKTAVDVQEDDISSIRVTLAETLNTFLRQSTIGEFQSRLDLIKGVAKQLDYSPSVHAHALKSTVKNVHKLHLQYLKAAVEHISTEKVKLEKGMREIILLASWKDTNINALKESTRRSHYQLYKVVKKYRAVLATSISTIAQVADLSKLEISSVTMLPRTLEQASNADRDICAASVADWESRPARHLNISSTVTKMQQTFSSVAPTQSACSLVDQFSDHVLQRAQELRDATPSKLTKENTVEVRRLQDAKRKAVSEALKSLRQMGFKSNVSQKELAGQSSLEKILGLSPAFEGRHFHSRIGEIDDILVATLDNLSKTRGVMMNIPEDVPVPDFVRGAKYFEHGLSMVVTQRKALASHLDAFHRLEQATGYLLVLCESQSGEAPPSATIYATLDPQMLSQSLGWLRANIQFAVRVVEAEAKFIPGDHCSKLQEILLKWKDWSSEMSKSLTACPKTFPNITMPQESDTIRQITKGFEDMHTEFTLFGESNIKLRHIVNYLQPWIPLSQQASAANKDSLSSLTNHGAISAADVEIRNACDMILTQLQPEAPDESLAKKVGGSDKTVLFEHERLLVSRASSSAAEIANQLESLGPKLHEAMADNPAVLRSLLRLMSPIIIEYERICHKELLQRLDFHRGLCRLTHILSNFVISIGTNGFCAPSDGSAEAGGPGQVESGTGLGDGEGEEDISNDIAPDEDLSELANQKEEGKPKEYDAQDNAVDNDDIDGLSESGDDKSDEEGDGEDGEEEDATDEMGKVDESHGLDSLDKDFWDNPAEEPKEEVDSGGDGKQEETATSNKEKSKKDEKQQKDPKSLESKEMELDDDDADAVSEASVEDESDAVENKTSDNINEHIPEVERLDISDDFKLDEMDQEEDEEEGDLTEGDEGEEDPLDKPLDKTDLTHQDSDDEDEEMGDYDAKMAEELDETAESDAEEKEKEGKEEEGDPLQQPTEDPIEDAQNGSTVPPNAKAAAASSSEDIDKDDVDPTSAQDNMEMDNQNDTGKDNSASNAMDGKGDSGKAEYRAGQGQSEVQPNEQRLENGLKKLGDLLEKVHRTPMEILNSETSQGPKDNVQNSEEQKQSQFEHIGEDDKKPAAQALGAAAAEESHAIDESMVIDSAPDPTEPTGEGDEEVGDNSNVEGTDGKPVDEQGAFQEGEPGVEDTAPNAASDSKEDPEATMEVDAPRLIGDSKHDNLESLDVDMDLDDKEEAEDLTTLENPSAISAYNEEAHSLWKLYENKTRVLSLSLTEQLRLILEPTLSTKLRGDYRTGKRLNMKRIIPYIASDYKKDKIWMRRTKPSKRQYQVMIALDDSKSMSESRCVELTFESIALVARALSHLEVGQISMVSFGESTKLVHPFEQPFTAQAGANVFAGLTFEQTKTNMRSLVDTSIKLFREARQTNSQSDLWQLELIISDGICEDHQEIQRLVRLAHFEKIVLIFVIIDATGGAITGDTASKGSSILDMKEVAFTGQGVQIKRYMDTFPFNYYLIIRRIEDLPGMLSTALRQWFSQAAEASS
ncbi:AAA ATPase midasin [Orbilia blumenaviensis]|uniref:Midasin n=1 Tax=Orbilia blumenaviensis TaxID=1796055 RepID=A0AAV9VCC4_9PEZI